MTKPVLLVNPVQRYFWGSLDGLATNLGIPNPEGLPAAELWMGAHPAAPSLVEVAGSMVGLDALIAQDPLSALGSRVCESLGTRLPFLFKGLSAGSPLSIQTHPDKAGARLGFERENTAGIPLSAPERNYKDDNHKPEMAVALTVFEGLCGFRYPSEIAELFSCILPPLVVADLSIPLALMMDDAGTGKTIDSLAPEAKAGTILRNLVKAILTIEGDDRIALLAAVAEGLATPRKPFPPSDEGAFSWVRKLAALYPQDASILMPLVLNHLVLKPGKAIFIDAGIMHAYLEGTALELMANSDNVLRGGLTPKHIDVPELLATLDATPGFPDIEVAGLDRQERPLPFAVLMGLDPEEFSESSENSWPIHATEFALSRIDLAPMHRLPLISCGPEILLCTEGSIRLQSEDEILVLTRGQSAFVPACASCLTSPLILNGKGKLYRAYVP